MATQITRPQGPAEIPGHESTRPLMRIAPRQLPRKLTELGRIRIGDREPNANRKGTHPHKLNEFRLTSPNSPLLHFAANLYGGEVRPWVGDGAPTDESGRPTQWELYTQANAMDVLIPTMSALSLQYELWSAGGCQRRCTGEVITHCADESQVGTECVCSPDDQERGSLAKTGKACNRILRLNVLLPDLPGMGSWRLETKGFYATAELLGTLEMLQMAGAEHQIIEGVLRLDQRTIKRPGTGEGKGTLKFVVPILWPKYTPRQILASAAQRGMLMMTPPVEIPQARLAERAASAADDLYGDGAGDIFRSRHEETPAGPLAGDYVPQIEALLVAQRAGLPAFWAWAERQKKKPQAQFTADDYADLLQRAQAQAKKRQEQEATTEPPRAAQVEPSVADVIPETLESTLLPPSPSSDASLPSTPGAWREMLAGLVADLQDSTLAQEAGSMLEDADASDEAGNAMVSRVLDALTGQADDASLAPF